MKKTIALLVALLLASNPVWAATVALSDHEMDTIAAGDWQVIKDADGNESIVEDLYYTTNDIKLNDESQMDIQAVSNANVVDSAVAVQTNIASVTGDLLISNDVSGSNEANLTNYNPSEESGSSSESSSKFSLDYIKNFTLASNSLFSLAKTENSWELVTETLDENYDKDVSFALAVSSESECSKDCESETVIAASYLEDENYDLDYDKNINSGSAKSLAIAASKTKNINSTETKSISKESSEKSSSYYRKNLSENNHIDLEDTAQMNIQAVSNLNSVGSAAAVQTNIATNVGVDGSIVHSNIATAVNGL